MNMLATETEEAAQQENLGELYTTIETLLDSLENQRDQQESLSLAKKVKIRDGWCTLKS